MENQRKVIIVSLAASLMAAILYVFGMTLAKGNMLIEVIYLLMASLLVVSAIISLFNNYKNGLINDNKKEHYDMPHFYFNGISAALF